MPSPDGGKAIDWAGTTRPATGSRSISALKIPGWMEELERRGGKLFIHDAGVSDLERYTEENDLVIVAAGKGEIVRLFERVPTARRTTSRCARSRSPTSPV